MDEKFNVQGEMIDADYINHKYQTRAKQKYKVQNTDKI